MTGNPFLSKEVSFKRILKGVAVSLPYMILLVIIVSNYFGSTNLNTQTSNVLGVESEPKLIGSYGDVNESDTFVWDWDSDWNRDGYYKLNRFVENPQYYISEKYFELKQTWSLKNGYKLSLSCTRLDMSIAIPGDIYPCSLTYNGQVLTKNLRYEAYCGDSQNLTNCHGSTDFVVYSNLYGDADGTEYIVLSEWASGSKDWVNVYRLNNGKGTLLPFVYNGVEEDRHYISASSYEMYGLYSDWENTMNFNDPIELVTYFHEPSMGSQSEDTRNNVEGIYRIWNVVDDKLVIKNAIVDLYKEGDIAHWL